MIMLSAILEELHVVEEEIVGCCTVGRIPEFLVHYWWLLPRCWLR